MNSPISKTHLLNFHDVEKMKKRENDGRRKSETTQAGESRNCNPFRKVLPDRIKNYWKTILLAYFLLICGISFLVIAVYIIFLPDSNNGPHSYVFFLCGFICVIPGGYHVGFIYFASRGRAGYKLEELPTFSDE